MFAGLYSVNLKEKLTWLWQVYLCHNWASVKLLFLCKTGENAKANAYDITYVVKETRRVTGGLSTLVGTNEGSLVCCI